MHFRLILLFVVLAGAFVSAAGAIGFVICWLGISPGRLSAQNQWRLPMAAIAGAILLISGDILGRVLIDPREIPAGIVTAVTGTPYLIYLLQRARRVGRQCVIIFSKPS